jgi:MFS family permease
MRAGAGRSRRDDVPRVRAWPRARRARPPDPPGRERLLGGLAGAPGRVLGRKQLRPSLEPLREREFRLLFFGRTISVAGNAFTNVALAFAVLELTGSKADLGYVLAAQAVPLVVFMLVGGIWADRLPRHRVMVASNLVNGTVQAVTAVLLLTGHAEVWQLIVLSALGGTSFAFFFPASIGIVPQTVPPEALQSANALLRLGVNATRIGGAALAGLIVGLTSPGVGIAADAVSFFVAAALVGAMHLPSTLRIEGRNFIAELAEGWREFISRTWLWAIVLQFGFVNAVVSGTENVLGPVIAKQHLGGATAWGLLLTATSIGLIFGGLLVLRFRPRRILLAATLGYLLSIPILLGLAIPLPLVPLIALALMAGVGNETFGVLWDTAVQQEIPEEKLSRVSSYDALGSFALIPLGLAAAGPIADLIGTRETLIGAAAISLTATLAVLLVRDVRTLPRRVVPVE